MRFRINLGVIATLVVVLFILISKYFLFYPRQWGVNEIAIAYWVWQKQMPDEADIQKAFHDTSADMLFLHTGQFDLENGTIKKIHDISGALPASVKTHLVYNGTRRFLSEWENFEAQNLAAQIAATYKSDRARASQARIIGLQLDFDVPTRLLPKYAQVLQSLRKLLPVETQLSITGLPTWAQSYDLKSVLDFVDFWIPQCYGARIPDHLKKEIPISSITELLRTLETIRRFRKPFYVGLAAYSYAILYAPDGALIELRGDLDPTEVANHPELELIESRNFIGQKSASGERKYIYRAQTAGVTEGLIFHAGDSLVFDIPSAETLRENARVVRENAGKNLLGICIFRLPTTHDETVLSPEEINTALMDQPVAIKTEIATKIDEAGRLLIFLTNKGTASGILGQDALTLELETMPNEIRDISLSSGFGGYKTLCREPETQMERPCSRRRATIIRFYIHSWKPGTQAAAVLSFTNHPPDKINALVTTRVNDGRIVKEQFAITLGGKETYAIEP